MEQGIARGVGSAQNAGERPACGGSNGGGGREQHPPTGNSHQGSSAHGGAKNVTGRGKEGATGGARMPPPSIIIGFISSYNRSLFLLL